ncbi:glycoside hydrolase family 115 protein [Colletotrichum tofieldiae]|uniref:Glycoside hydrolase family 115 protein n=1 Tax=Colletotrichum tofieldiae TaxID=708197 RepID=A0A166PGC4_9PEZI|nr:glycoside hydrolase family 115 protein [Colletotrichum tofieldiae]
MFEKDIVTFSSEDREPLSLVGATILVDESDPVGIHIAAQNLAEDFGRVTRSDASHVTVFKSTQNDVVSETTATIIIGCIQSSRLIQQLGKEGKLDTGKIRGKWESFTTAVIEQPLPGIKTALVIAGSDKRGTIFGAYTLSEQIGVSPWYYWADVPPKSHKEIFALRDPTHHGEPSVRFRGLFINDEAPALTGWARAKFGGYNSEFYKKVFELLLRLKANFLWPAMWPGYPNPGASFFTDDPENAQAAEDYGIAVSTSHHEPMQRLSNEWFAENPDGSWNWLTNKEKITAFFDEGIKRAKGRESYFTLGMRGEYDRKMKTDDPAAVVRDVIKTQRALIKQVHGSEDAVPQLLALYKEVQEQYEGGNLDVPDDVTLLFADDNFGSIRRLPSGAERDRKGGAGIYYHFEYVGVPRSYKWINSNSLGKTWHQLQEAHRRNAKQVWVFNIGDIKPMEVPLTFAMTLAWDINSIEANDFANFYQTMAGVNYGYEKSEEIAAVWQRYDRLAALRRHEHIEPTTFSLVHYNEADDIISRWESLLKSAESIHNEASEEQKASIFETVLHPVKASTIFTKLQITLGRNRLYARQRRNTANKLAREVLDLFDADYSLSEEFHELLDGKWDQIMRQTHYGYEDTWHAPYRDMISGLCYVQRRQYSNPVMGQMGIAVEGHEGVRPGRTNEESDRTHPSRRDLVPGVTLGQMSRYGPSKRWFDIYTRGPQVTHWKASAPHAWLRLSTTAGTLDPDGDDARVEITVDWGQVPDTFDQEVLVDIRSEEGDFEQVHVPITGRRAPGSFRGGFVETDGYVSIPAVHRPPPGFRVLPECGRTPAGAIAIAPNKTDASSQLVYKFYVFSQPAKPVLSLYFNMTLDLDPADPMSYELEVDGRPVQRHQLLPKTTDLPDGWFHAVQDCAWLQKHDLSDDGLESGEHNIKIKLRHSNLILEKLVVDLGGVKESYLGPPPSSYVS